jgi:hypothetical protein
MRCAVLEMRTSFLRLLLASIFVQLLISQAVHLPFEPEDHFPVDSTLDSSPALPDIRPDEICLVTDHEPIPTHTCETLFRDVDAVLHVDDARRTRTVEGFQRVGARLWDTWAEHYQVVIPCMNRDYACQHGYNFIMPSSPWLTILQPGFASAAANNRTAELRAIAGAESACAMMNATVSKGHILRTDTVRRSNTWCKIAIMAVLARDLPGCRVLTFLDADLLLLPANNWSYTYSAKISLEEALRIHPQLRRTQAELQRRSHSRAWVLSRMHEELMAREQASHAVGGAPLSPPNRRLLLHEQREVKEFLLRPGATVLANHAARNNHRRPLERQLKDGARVNSVMSSCWMVVKNTPRLQRIFYEWCT